MKKRLLLTAILVLIALSVLTTPVSAKGPIYAGGASPVVPFNWGALEHSLLAVMPLLNEYLGSATTIWEDDVTITVDEIPPAYCDENTWECEGTCIQLKWSRAYEAATNPYAPYYTGEYTTWAWVIYKFWLNGYGPVTITRYYDGTSETENVTEFIYFKVQWVGNGEGNSDYDASGNFDVTILAYE